LEAFKNRITALTQGQVEFITIETRDNTIIPIKK
jgi:hypothetical protein